MLVMLLWILNALCAYARKIWLDFAYNLYSLELP